MRNRLVAFGLVVVLGLAAAASAQEQVVIRGVVEEIAADGSFIVVAGQKLLTDTEFLEESFIEVEDEIEIIAQPVPEGLKIIDYDFIIEGFIEG